MLALVLLMDAGPAVAAVAAGGYPNTLAGRRAASRSLRQSKNWRSNRGFSRHQRPLLTRQRVPKRGHHEQCGSCGSPVEHSVPPGVGQQRVPATSLENGDRTLLRVPIIIGDAVRGAYSESGDIQDVFETAEPVEGGKNFYAIH